MSEKDDKKTKKRASKYEEKVTFDGTFEDMVKISVKDAEKRVKERKEDVGDIYHSKHLNESIDLNSYRVTAEYNSEPYYYILFKGTKIEWKYLDKEKRDKEIKAIREQKSKLNAAK